MKVTQGVRGNGIMGLALLALLAAGCSGGPGGGGGAPATSANSGLQGKVAIDGSSTVYPISEAMASNFRKTNPDVNTPVGQSGTGGGFKRFTVGETDISDASRPIKASEFEQCKKNDVQFVELPVAYDGLTVVVHPSNDFVSQLTIDQLKKIFRAPGAKTWKDVDAKWPSTPIKIYAPGTDSGTFDYFKEVIVGKDENISIRTDMSVNEDDNVLVRGVSQEKAAIGFFGAAYYFENKEALKAVPIVNPKTNKAVMVSPQTVENGDYAPFSRPLFIYVNLKSLKRPEVKRFVNFYLQNAAKVAAEVGYVGLPPEIYAEAQKHLDDRLAGTHYLTAEGEAKTGTLASLYQADARVDTK